MFKYFTPEDSNQAHPSRIPSQVYTYMYNAKGVGRVNVHVHVRERWLNFQANCYFYETNKDV